MKRGNAASASRASSGVIAGRAYAAYQAEAEAWRRFWIDNVVSIRPVYFDRDFYARHYGSEREERQFITLMADPIHPNALGHHVLADALAPLVCPPP